MTEWRTPTALAAALAMSLGLLYDPRPVIPMLAILGPYSLGWADNAVNYGIVRSGHCVYYLFDRRSVLLYVGSTNDVARRALEHTNPADHGSDERWKREVYGVSVARWCRSERQARRIEERRIRALIVAANATRCPPLHNDIWSQPTRKPTVRAWRWAWSIAYLAESFVHPARRWHAPSCHWRVIPHRDDTPEPDDEHWSDNTANPSYYATYERPEEPSRNPRRVLELPPAGRHETRHETSHETSHENLSLLRREKSRNQSRTDFVTPNSGTTVTQRVRDAHRRHVAAVTADPPPPDRDARRGPGRPPKGDRPMTAAERQAARRQRARRES